MHPNDREVLDFNVMFKTLFSKHSDNLYLFYYFQGAYGIPNLCYFIIYQDKQQDFLNRISLAGIHIGLQDNQVQYFLLLSSTFDTVFNNTYDTNNPIDIQLYHDSFSIFTVNNFYIIDSRTSEIWKKQLK